jgi:hypothetical protein
MRKFNAILVASLVAASLYAAAGTAWARSEVSQRGTSWTASKDAMVLDVPAVLSWKSSSPF